MPPAIEPWAMLLSFKEAGPTGKLGLLLSSQHGQQAQSVTPVACYYLALSGENLANYEIAARGGGAPMPVVFRPDG